MINLALGIIYTAFRHPGRETIITETNTGFSYQHTKPLGPITYVHVNPYATTITIGCIVLIVALLLITCYK